MGHAGPANKVMSCTRIPTSTHLDLVSVSESPQPLPGTRQLLLKLSRPRKQRPERLPAGLRHGVPRAEQDILEESASVGGAAAGHKSHVSHAA